MATPAAPTDLASPFETANSVNLTWTITGHVTAVLVERKKVNDVSWVSLIGLIGSQTTWVSTGLTPGTAYMYRVRSYLVGSGFSDYSSVLTVATPGPVTSPADPSDLSVSPVSFNEVDLGWADNSDNESGFSLERSLASDSGFAEIARVGAGTVVYSDLTVAPSTTYFYRVRAFLTQASAPTLFSGYTPVMSALTGAPALQAPNAPSSLTAVAGIGAASVSLSWTDNADNESAFVVERSADGGITWQTLSNVVVPDTVLYVDQGPLILGASYVYRVKAVNAAGASNYSNTASVTLPNVPNAPSLALAAALSSSSVQVTWRDNSADEQQFAVERALTAGGPYSQVGSVQAGVTSFTDSGLAATTQYFYRVKAVNAVGSSAYSNTTSAITQAQPSNPPPALVAGHPRFLVTQDDLANLRSTFAVNSNPIWLSMVDVANQCKALQDAGTIPSQDTGSYANTVYPTEMYAEMMAFMSLVDPDSSKRADWAQRAHDLIMHVFNIAVLGAVATNPFTPFRDPAFSTSDRCRWYGEAFSFVVDWVYQTFTSQEKATIRTVFLRWSNELFFAPDSGSPPFGGTVMNDPRLTALDHDRRWSANNYWCGHMRNFMLMARALDPGDDPDGSLTSVNVAKGFGIWAYIRDAAENRDYAGSISPEGTEYGTSSLGEVSLAMLAMHTSGTDDPNIYGHPTRLMDGPFWQNYPTALAHSKSPGPISIPNNSGIPATYVTAEFGDAQSYFPLDQIVTIASVGLYAKATGNSALYDACRWEAANFAKGGPSYRGTWMHAALDDGLNSLGVIMYFLLLDPSRSAATDPRSGFPLFYAAPGLARLLSRTDWGTNATWFGTICPWIAINHQGGTAGGLFFFRNGEPLVWPRVGYGVYHACSDNHNAPSLQGDNPQNPTSYSGTVYQRGSQWIAQPFGDPSSIWSDAAGYTYSQDYKLENLYNSTRFGTFAQVHASRSIFWLKSDHVIVYTRSAHKSSGYFSRDEWSLPVIPGISGRVATGILGSGQRIHITSVLPSSVQMQAYDPLNSVLLPGAMGGEQEDSTPMHARLRIEDPANPADVRLLTVLQGANTGVGADACSLVQSNAGDAFDGVLVHNTVLMFKRDITTVFSSVTFVAPSGATAVYASGLVPGASYNVATSSVGGGAQVIVTPGGSLTADAGGVIKAI